MAKRGGSQQLRPVETRRKLAGKPAAGRRPRISVLAVSIALVSPSAGVFAASGCSGLLGLRYPQDDAGADAALAMEATTDAAVAVSEDAAPPEVSTDNEAEIASDAAVIESSDDVVEDSTGEEAADASRDGQERDAAGDGGCGVCVSGATEACGTGGMQTCSAQCRWGACSVTNTVGCSDGTRDGFVGAAFPRIAGCLGDWNEGSMRAPKTGVACGNSLAVRCAVPADLCAAGWHVCGTPPYGSTDISSKITNAQCTGGPAASYLAALGDLECEPCSSTGFGAVCCGTTCIQQNGNCVWPDATPWVGVIGTHMNLCSDVFNTYPTSWGALCCMD
jgi:hypothetical protein